MSICNCKTDYSSAKDRDFILVDTGGFLPDESFDVLAESVRNQIFAAVEDADVVLFMVDIRVGVTELDLQFAKMVKRLEKQVILVANKGEDIAHRNEAWEFLSLGLGAPRSISALTGYACLSLLDEVILTDIYPARELPIEGVSSELIYNHLRAGIEKTLCTKEEVLDVLRNKHIEVLITLGAGDIENYASNICEILKEKC